MNCPNCGNPIEGRPQFCPKCFSAIEESGLWQKLLAIFKGKSPRLRPLVKIKKTVTIKIKDKDGQQHEYHSIDELPGALANEIKKLKAEALKEVSSDSAVLSPTVTTTKSTSIYKVKDASGAEHIYHSLEELPSELRA